MSDKPQGVQVVIDYLTISTKIHSPVQCVEMLGLLTAEFVPIKSFLGYANCDYYEGVRIHWTHTAELSEVCIDLSGKGCRTVEHMSNMTFDWFEFLHNFEPDLKAGDVHISRLDIAGDEFDGVLDFNKLTAYTQAKKYICKAKVEPWGTWGRKLQIYFGSEQSNRLVRFYDKALEQGSDITHWLRCEMQMRNECALSFLLNWFNVKSIGNSYAGVLFDYLRFTTKPNTDNAHNGERLSTAGFWTKFIGNLGRLPQLYLQGREYSIERCVDHIRRSAGSSIKTMLYANGGDVSGLFDVIAPVPINKQQKLLLESMDVKQDDNAVNELVTRNWDKLSQSQRNFLIAQGYKTV